MSRLFPSKGIQKKVGLELSADATALASQVLVGDNDYGVLYKLWVGTDVASETDLENLPGIWAITVTIGSTIWYSNVHPFISHVDAQTVVVEHRTVDLGPWDFDFGQDGLYSGVKGDNIQIAVTAGGTGIKTRVSYIYSD